MKTIVISFILGIFLMTGSVAQELTVQYNASQHTVTLKASNVKITKIIDKLSTQGVQVYLLDDKASFKVNANYSNTLLDEVLEKIMPAGTKYFYKIESAKGERAVLAKSKTSSTRGGRLSIAKTKQIGDKLKISDANKPKLKKAQDLMIAKKTTLVRPTNALRDKYKPRNVSFKGRSAMQTANKISIARNVRPVDKGAVTNTVTGNRVQSGKKHLVVTYKVTKNGITAVSTAEEEGEYIAPTEVYGDQAIIGIDNNKAVIAETFEDPLSYRSIYVPGKSDHRSFTSNEAYITVHMPIQYKTAVASKKLKMQLVRFKQPEKAVNVLQKIKSKQLKSTEVNTSFQVLKRASVTDFSKLKKQ